MAKFHQSSAKDFQSRNYGLQHFLVIKQEIRYSTWYQYPANHWISKYSENIWHMINKRFLSMWWNGITWTTNIISIECTFIFKVIAFDICYCYIVMWWCKKCGQNVYFVRNDDVEIDDSALNVDAIEQLHLDVYSFVMVYVQDVYLLLFPLFYIYFVVNLFFVHIHYD